MEIPLTISSVMFPSMPIASLVFLDFVPYAPTTYFGQIFKYYFYGLKIWFVYNGIIPESFMSKYTGSKSILRIKSDSWRNFTASFSTWYY